MPHHALAPLLAVSLLAVTASADERFRLDAGVTLSRFEQQVKSEVGGARGERLVEQTDVGVAALGTYRVWGPIALGLYVQYDAGVRQAGRFQGLDAEGRAVVVGEVGGDSHELWLGPVLRLSWRTLFAEAAWAPLGLRWDTARDDLPDASGSTDGALRTHLGIAWYLALGGGIPVLDGLQVVLRLEYRVRYYDRREENLADSLVHGTQNFTPFIGVAWTP